MIETYGNTAVVVSHPDDETLWCGGIIQPGWTVICCSIPFRDPVRAYNFFRACEVYEAKPRLNPVSEKYWSLDFSLDEFDTVITHGAKGEYGHHQHIAVHHWVVSNFHGHIYCFGGDIVVPLSSEQLDRKKLALTQYDHETVYKHQKMRKWEALEKEYGISKVESYLALARN